jgi:alkylated DNA repair dioxygenase AlkB
MTTLPAGFRYFAAWATTVDMAALVSQLQWEQPTIRLFGKSIPAPRLTSWMGAAPYTYSGKVNTPASTPAIITSMQTSLQAFTGATFNSVLANHYRNGQDSVAWHADDEPELGEQPTIASLSFGASRKFSIKCKATGETTSLILNHGDLLVMDGLSQAEYLHSVPKTKKVDGARINLTFRLVQS